MGDGVLHYPTGVHIQGNRLLVADAYNYQIQEFDLAGNFEARLGYHLFWLWPRPVSSSHGFGLPTGAVIDSQGFLHVADSGNHRVVMLGSDRKYIGHWNIPDAGATVFSPEKVALSLDEERIYATDWGETGFWSWRSNGRMAANGQVFWNNQASAASHSWSYEILESA